MRGAGSDLGIEPGGIEAFLRDRWVVVEVNEIMRDAGMLRLTLEIGSRMAAPLSWLAYVLSAGEAEVLSDSA